MKLLTFSPSLVADLDKVEQVILNRVSSRSVVMRAAGHHLINSGGKRLRAALALLTAQLGTYQFDHVVHAATAVELIHAASLTHDDLVDEAERRRGTVTVHKHWDHGVALMVGDYLFALAAGEMALAPDPRIITHFSNAVIRICEGELAPVMVVTPLETACEQYYYKIGAKTAGLFEAACRAGMTSGGGTTEQIEALGNFGNELGLAFQIIDDVLDFTGDVEQLGKPAGNDLRQGTITLPLILAFAASGNPKLIEAIDSSDETVINAAIAEVRRLGVEPARTEAQHLVDRALTRLDTFPDSLARQLIGDIAAFVLDRDI